MLAWAIAGVLSLAPDGAEPPAAEASAARSGTARLVFPAEHAGTVAVEDPQGQPVATVTLGRRVVVELPPGSYVLRDAKGTELSRIEVEADQVREVSLPESWREPEPVPLLRPRVPVQNTPAVTTGRLGPEAPVTAQEVELVKRRRWTRWAAPLLSAVVPGGGQALSGQPGRGLAVFTGTVGLVLGTIAVAAARDPSEGAAPGGPDGGNAREVVRLMGLAGLSSAAGLLYLGQILDAHAQAADRRPRPLTRHRLALELSRATTVAFAPGRPAYDLYTDWSLAIMGQIAPRVTLGLSDASIKYARHRQMLTVQAGVRAAYRFYEGRRVWLGAGGGALLQGTRADPSLPPSIDGGDPPQESAERAFSVVPYAHFDARLFLLDRWSLGLMPRVSVPMLPRRFAGAATLPRYATTFELAAGLGVYF